MENGQYEWPQTELQRSLAAHFLQEEYNVFITLTFRTEDSVSYAYAKKSFGRFIHRVRCTLYKERSKYRLPMVPVIESYPGRSNCSDSPQISEERTHIHCCIKLPGNPEDHKELVRRLWLDAGGACGDPTVHCKDSGDWFKVIRTIEEMRKSVNYSMKQCACDHEPVLWEFARKIQTA